MPTMWETFPVPIEGGLITNTSAIQQGINMPGSAARLVNFEPSIRGGYRRINGYSKWDPNVVPSADPTTQLLGVGFLDGNVITAREGSVYTSVGAGWTSRASGRTQPNKVRYTISNLDGTRRLIATDGSNYPYLWAGSTISEVTTSADVLGARHSIEFKDHIFYSKGNLVTFAVPFTYDDFTTADGAGSFRVDNDVVGMIVFRERLFIFSPTSIWVLDGTSVSDFALTSVSKDIGCVGEDTVQEVSGDVAFMGPDGVRLLGATDRDGDFSNQVASRRIQQESLQLERDYDTFSSLVVREKSQYRIFGYRASRDAFATDGYIGTQFESQNPNSFSWGQTSGLKVYSADSRYYNGEEHIVFVSDTSYVYRMDSGPTFDGADIPSSYWTPYLSLSDPHKRKTLYKVDIFFDPEESLSGRLNLNFNFDASGYVQPDSIPFSADGGGSLFGGGVFGVSLFATSPSSVINTLLVGSGEQVQFQFEFDGSEPFNLDTLLIEFATKDRQ